MKSYMPVVADILSEDNSKTILDAPSGNGWLLPLLVHNVEIDGIDLFEQKPDGYRDFIQENLDKGIPSSLPKYDAFVSCEGIEHIGNPLLFLETIKDHLNSNGLVIITTPNVWYPNAKIQYFLRGFSPSFPCLVGKIKKGMHMHIAPWTFPQLYLYLKLSGYSEIRLHNTADKKPKHFSEKILGIFQRLYCNHKKKRSKTSEEKDFWEMSGSRQSVYGRRLVVSARNSD